MAEPLYYLRTNIKFEPLIARWYAWPHLLSPATAALNLRRRYLDILKTYLKAPQVHAAAVRNPALMGGPFIDLPVEHIDKVKQLLHELENDHAEVLALADAFVACQTMLRAQAKGGSLERLYQEVPAALRGYVELIYNISHTPAIRLIEALLYRSKHYRKSMQSLMLSPMESDYRPFILSTPRFVLDAQTEIDWCVPFDDARIDYLVALRESPRPLAQIAQALGWSTAEAARLPSLLTDQAPPIKADRNYAGDGIRIRYFGHACLLIETDEVAILVDPLLSYEHAGDLDRFTMMDLPERIDYILLTHAHADHVSFEWLLQLRAKTGHIVFAQNESGFLPDPSCRLMFNALGFKTTIGLPALDHIDVPGGQIVAIPFLGEHGDLDIQGKSAYLLKLKGKQIMVAADLCHLEPRLYQMISDIHGKVDMLFLGMECDGAPFSWIYGPCMLEGVARQFDQERKLNGSNFERAMSFVQTFQCKEVVVYAMGMEPWLGHIMALAYSEGSPQLVESDKLMAACRSAGIAAERPFGKREWLLDAGNAGGLQ